MIPISPMTVKFTDEERTKLKGMAALLGWTESQVVRDSLAYSHSMIFSPNDAKIPRLVTMGRLALRHNEDSAFKDQPANMLPATPRPKERTVK